MHRSSSFLASRRSVLAGAASLGLLGAGSVRAQDADPRDAALDAAMAHAAAPPAIAAAVVGRAGLEWSGVRGVRRKGEEDAATQDDRWHLGSNAKAMTAAAFARLVERGQARFGMPLAEVFPDVSIDAGFEGATLDDLMRHLGGLEDRVAMASPVEARVDPRSPVEQRAATVARALGSAPTKPRGTFAYANVNYVILGAALERITGKSSEEVLTEEVFQPLGLSSAGFGAPVTNAAGGSNVWGHRPNGAPVDPASPFSDNPPFLVPAGAVHMTVADYGRYMQATVGGGPVDWLKPETLAALTAQTEGAPGYALGWLTQPASWAGGKIGIGHEGSNTLWHSFAIGSMDLGLGFIVLSNGGLGGRPAAVELMRSLIAIRTGTA